jgi:hypothetical protein
VACDDPRFGFSKWAVSLNDMPPGLDALLPPSDVRWRQDVRLLEQGRYDEVRSHTAAVQHAARSCSCAWMTHVGLLAP